MSKPISVLVTGSSGRIGRAAVAELMRRGHMVRGFDRTPTPGLEDCVIGDLTDRGALDHAMEKMECLVHLAATPDDAPFLESLLPNNITGLFHVMEAARCAGVGRVVLASSGQVNWWQQATGPFPIRPEHPTSPKAWYAATKMFMESAGRTYVEMHGMSAIIARLGWCPRDLGQVAEIAASELFRDVYLSPGDAGRFIACAVEAAAGGAPFRRVRHEPSARAGAVRSRFRGAGSRLRAAGELAVRERGFLIGGGCAISRAATRGQREAEGGCRRRPQPRQPDDAGLARTAICSLRNDSRRKFLFFVFPFNRRSRRESRAGRVFPPHPSSSREPTNQHGQQTR